MQDRAPANRAQRRQAARRQGATLVRPVGRPRNPSGPQSLVTGTGSPSAETASASDEDEPVASTFPPADEAPKGRKISHHAGGGKQERIYKTLVSYYALAGLAVSRWDQSDGMLIVSNAEACADAWIVAGKAQPSIMHALEMITVAGPYTALIMVHVQMAFSIMDRHGANPFKGLLSPVAAPSAPTQSAKQSPSAPRSEPAPLPYVPVGANAPTEAMPGPEVLTPDMLVIPDEGLPAEIDVALREMARETGRPYQELRQEAIVELAQLRMQQNGHTQTPGALGAPIARG